MAYRHINYKNGILWTLAYQLGLDPSKELLIDQAAAITSYVNAWVRKSWDSTDWPEWTNIQIFSPDANHIVPYSYFTLTSTLIPSYISRVFKVYLTDPHLTQGSYDTPFRLFSEGVHCGFEHGTSVWIRFILNPPQFTSDQWDPNRTYQVNDMAYSPVTGECYSSISSNNIGNDPSLVVNPPLIPSTLVQAYVPPSPGLAGQARISNVLLAVSGVVTIPDPPPNLSKISVTVMDTTGTVLGSVIHLNNGIDSLATIAASIATALQAALSGFTVTSSGSVITIKGTTTSDFLLIWSPTSTLPYYQPLSGIIERLVINQVQPFIPTVPAVPVTPQVVNLTLTNSQVFAGATYQLAVTDLTGLAHIVTYTALIDDGAPQIMQGLMAAAVASTDPFFAQVFLSLLPSPVNTQAILQVRTLLPYAVDIFISTAGNQFWTFIPFPFALADIVLRGAYADCLKEWGQNEKAGASEQLAVQEGMGRAQTFLGPPTDKLSDQTQPKPRYSVP